MYAYTSLDRPDSVTLLANWIPFEEPNGGPNFYAFGEDLRYNIKIDNTGDGVSDITYTWRFHNKVRDAANQFLYNTGPVTSLNDPDLNFRQVYDLVVSHGSKSKVLLSDVPAAPSRVGPASMPNYAALRNQAIRNVPGGGKTFMRPGGRLVLRRPPGLRPPVRREPERDRPGHPRGLQRQLRRPSDPQGTARAEGEPGP